MMIPEVGSTCQYKFAPAFAALDGIYTLMSRTTYEVAISEGVDFLKGLYNLVGKSASDLSADDPSYRGSVVLKLKDVQMHVDEDEGEIPRIIYVPVPILDAVPDPMVRRYSRYAVAINLGLIDDQESIDWIEAHLKDIATSVTGTPSEVQIYEIGHQWMSEAAYAAIEQERESRISQLTTHFANVQRQLLLIQELKTKLNYYETHLKSIAAAQAPTE